MDFPCFILHVYQFSVFLRTTILFLHFAKVIPTIFYILKFLHLFILQFPFPAANVFKWSIFQTKQTTLMKPPLTLFSPQNDVIFASVHTHTHTYFLNKSFSEVIFASFLIHTSFLCNLDYLVHLYFLKNLLPRIIHYLQSSNPLASSKNLHCLLVTTSKSSPF